MTTKQLMEKAMAALETVNKLNRDQGVAMPLHEAMDFLEAAIKEESAK